MGANVASAVTTAANGSTICLNNGNYGSVNLFNISRTGFVTLKSTSGIGAQMSPQPGNSDFIRFQNLTLTSVVVTSCSTHIEFVGNTWVQNQDGLLFDASPCPNTAQNNLVDGDTFDRVQQAVYEGRLNCRDCNTVTIKKQPFPRRVHDEYERAD